MLDWNDVVSFSLPYLSVPPSLSAFTASHDPAAAAAADTDVEPSHPSQSSANSADAMTQVMSQIIAQMAAGQIVSCCCCTLLLLLVLLIIILMSQSLFMVLSLCHNHCKSSPGSSDECSKQRQVAANLWTKPISLSQ